VQQRALAFVVFFLAALPLAARADGVEPFYGSFGTEVPIDVPEFHALEPRLKLSYGSSGGDGFVGVGWSLSGLSIIERVGPRQSTPTYGASDGFVLDGQELVADASLGGTHSTRIQSYQRVRRDAAADRWYVWQKDGTRATYAPLYGTGLGTFRWAVVAIDDTRGNNVSYGWWCGGGDCYPDAITYNGTTVRFYREARPDPITFATGAGLGTTSYRLRSIDVTTGGSRVRTYRLGYATSGATRRTILASVQLFGRDAAVDASGAVLSGSSMPAMTMTPTTGGTSFLAGTWGATTPQHERNGSAVGWPSAGYWAGHGGGQTNNALGDFDGDGATDMAGYAGGGQWHVCLSRGTGFSCAMWAGHGGGQSNNALGDYNGDGATDMAGYAGNGQWHVCLSTGSGFSCAMWAGHGGGESNNFVGDYNGDGADDLSGYAGNGQWHTCLSTGSGFSCAMWAGHGGGQTNNVVADFNGDGADDMSGYAGSGQWHTCLSTGAGFSCAMWAGHGGGQTNNFVGDYNGDGAADLSGYAGNGQWHTCLSTGGGFSCAMYAGHGGGQTNNFVGDYNGDGAADMAGYAGNGQWHVTTTAIGQYQTFDGDFDGDGRSDLATVSKNGSGGWASWVAIERSTGGGFASTTWAATTPAHMRNGGSFRDYRTFSGDFDGDGKSDLATVSATGGGGWADWIAIERSTGGGFASGAWPAATPAHMRNGGAHKDYQTIPGDFDGDGKTDLATISKNGGGGWADWIAIERSTGGGFASAAWLATTPAHMRNGGAVADYVVVPGDFNGDGRTDLATVSRNGGGGWADWIAVELSTGAGFSSRTWAAATPAHMRNGGSHKDYVVIPGDFNGDGRTDLATVTKNGGGGWGDWIAVELSTGNGFVSQAWPASLPAHMRNGGALGDYQITGGDVNGDGKTDLVTASRNAGGGWGDWIEVEQSTGAGFASTAWSTSTPAHMRNGGAARRYEVFTLDVDGNGLRDLATVSRDGGGGWAGWVAIDRASGATPDLLATLTNGLGGTTAIGYTPSSGWANTYLPVGMIVPTASSVTSCDGRGACTSSSYRYDGGLWAASERRFLGFRKVTGVVDALGNYTETYYHQHVGCIAKPEVTYFRDSAGRIWSYSSYAYAENAAAPYTSLLTDRWDFECDLGTTCQRVVSQLAYDTYGNAIETREWGNYDASGDERTTVRGYYPNTAAYVVAAPAYEQVYAGIGTAGRMLKREVRWYDGATAETTPPTRGDVTSRRYWNDQTGGYVGEALAYDAWGNLIRETDRRGNARTTEYDPIYHRFPTRRCDALGRCRTTSYDAVIGQATADTDPDGRTTTRTWDAFGRAVRETRPDGGWVERQYLSWGSPTSQRLRTITSDGSADGLWEDEYFDGLERAYQWVREGGATRLREYFQGTRRPWKESGWYAPATETPRYTTKTYDGAGRLITVANPDGTTADVAYAICFNGADADFAAPRACSTVYDELDHAVRRATDGLGQVVLTSEWNAGVEQRTRYGRDPLGRLTSIRDAAGNTGTRTWSSLGNKLGECDPDLGCWSYEYDADGNRVAQTDAKGQRLTFAYDAVGRRVARSLPGGAQVLWRYDEVGRGATGGDAPTSVTWPTGSDALAYDAGGRVVSSTRCVTGGCRTTGWAYDVAGRLQRLTYGDGAVVTYGYDGAGRLSSVPGYASSLRYDARGQLTELTYANGVVQRYAYDQGREWLTSSTVTAAAGASLYHASYGYDAAARVTSMGSTTDARGNLSLGYDDLNRLTTVSGGQSASYAYDALGNFTRGPGGAAYAYADPAHRHAATATGGGSYAYDANGNMTTGGGRTYTWDAENRLAALTGPNGSASYTYDPDGQRTSRTTAAGTTRSWGKLLDDGPDGVTRYVYAGPVLLAQVRGASDVRYVHADHLGSVQLMTDAAGAVIKRHDYAPYGAQLASEGAADNRRGFGGHETDPESGLVYMNARYYDPALGRFLSADTMIPDLANPQALNRYAFAYGNPIVNADPTGHAPVIAAVVAVATVIASSAPAWVVAVAVVGAACTVAGYVLKDPTLMTIGMVALGFATGYVGPLLGGIGGGLLGASVAALTSPLSPLDPGVKQAIGWAYAAASFVAGQVRSSQELSNLESAAKETAAKEGVAAETLAKFEDPTRAQMSAYVAAKASNTSMQQVLETVAKTDGGAGFGLVGPGTGTMTTLLEKTVGWLPSVRLHGIIHDAYGFMYNSWSVGPGYQYAGWEPMPRGMPVSGQLTGVFRNTFLQPYGLSEIDAMGRLGYHAPAIAK